MSTNSAEANLKQPTSSNGEYKKLRGRIKEIVPTGDGKNLDVIFCLEDEPNREIRILAPMVRLADNTFVIVHSTEKVTKPLRENYSKDWHKELEKINAAFFAGNDDWSAGDRFLLKSNLWYRLAHAAAAIEADGADTDPALLDIVLQAIKFGKACEGRCSSDLDILKKMIRALKNKIEANKLTENSVKIDHSDALSRNNRELS